MNKAVQKAAWIVTACLGLGGAVIVSAQDTTQPFIDVEEGFFDYVAINYLHEKGLVQGYEDGTFKPDQPINRAEALTMLMNALKKTTPGTSTPEENIPLTQEAIVSNEETTEAPLPAIETSTAFYFPDVTPGQWFHDAVLQAWNLGLVDGYPDGQFHPEQNINVAESMKISFLYEGATLPITVTEQPYTDVPVDAWYAQYAQVAKERTIYLESRTDGSLNAQETMTRADFARLLYRILRSSQGARFARTTWYGREGVNWGTASGEKFDVNAATAAHKTLPFGTRLRVTNLTNKKSIIVTVTDRGPYPRGIDLDLTRSAFEALASAGTGIITTQFEILENNETPTINDPANPSTSDLPPSLIEYGF